MWRMNENVLRYGLEDFHGGAGLGTSMRKSKYKSARNKTGTAPFFTLNRSMHGFKVGQHLGKVYGITTRIPSTQGTNAVALMINSILFSYSLPTQQGHRKPYSKNLGWTPWNCIFHKYCVAKHSKIYVLIWRLTCLRQSFRYEFGTDVFVLSMHPFSSVKSRWWSSTSTEDHIQWEIYSPR